MLGIVELYVRRELGVKLGLLALWVGGQRALVVVGRP